MLVSLNSFELGERQFHGESTENTMVETLIKYGGFLVSEKMVNIMVNMS